MKIKISIIMVFLFILGGCQSTPTQEDSANADQQEKAQEETQKVKKSMATVLMRVHIKNVFKPKYQPKLSYINIRKYGLDGCYAIYDSVTGEDVENKDCYEWQVDNKYRIISANPHDGTDYLIINTLKPGKYLLNQIQSSYHHFFNGGDYSATINKVVDLSKPGVHYLGNIDLTVRIRESGEPRAGNVIPLIPQRVIGASGGTFDIVISDQFEADKAEFIRQMPKLAKVDIKKTLLPLSLKVSKLNRMDNMQNKDNMANKSNMKSKVNMENKSSCSIEQILSLKNANMSDKQIKAACN